MLGRSLDLATMRYPPPTENSKTQRRITGAEMPRYMSVETSLRSTQGPGRMHVVAEEAVGVVAGPSSRRDLSQLHKHGVRALLMPRIGTLLETIQVCSIPTKELSW
jgi:hypothetical protein